MSIKSQVQLENQASQIRDEQVNNGNTAIRLGTMFSDFIQSIYSTLSHKVDRQLGKQLSTQDFTTQEKNKLADLANIDTNDIYTQLANKVEQGDITTAIDQIKDSVPAAGDTLNKIYHLVVGSIGVSASATDIADRDASKSGLSDNQNIYVTDASADATVNSGWAVYKYLETGDTFIKIQEQESIDLIIQSATDTDEGLVKLTQGFEGSGADKAVSLDALKIEFSKYAQIITATRSVTHSVDGDPRIIDFHGIDYFTLTMDHNIGALSFSNLPLRRPVWLRIEQNAITGYAIYSITNLDNPDEVMPDYSTVADENSLWKITAITSATILVEGYGNIS